MTALQALFKAWSVDPKTTALMVDDIVYELVADEALAHSDLINKALAAEVAQRVAVAKRTLIRDYAASMAEGHYPDDAVHKTAEWLAGIEAYTAHVAQD